MVESTVILKPADREGLSTLFNVRTPACLVSNKLRIQMQRILQTTENGWLNHWIKVWQFVAGLVKAQTHWRHSLHSIQTDYSVISLCYLGDMKRRYRAKKQKQRLYNCTNNWYRDGAQLNWFMGPISINKADIVYERNKHLQHLNDNWTISSLLRRLQSGLITDKPLC